MPDGINYHLPKSRSRFLGRSEELRLLSELLADPITGLVTITGSGGVGKTRLAVQAAGDIADSFPDGVFFVPLGPVDSKDDIVQAIVSSMELTFFSSTEPLIEQLREYLTGRRTLLLLDCFEHLVDGAALVSELLDAADGLTILVTSRSPLGIPGESVFDLRGMICAEEDPAGCEPDGGALSLFEESAARAVPGFRLTWDLEPLAVEICRRLEGIPLAIELATSWLALMSLAEVYQEILRNPELVGTGPADMPPRHRSLLDVIHGTWRLLSAEERRVLESLSCFRGSFSREAALSVARTEDHILDALVGKSLLRTEGGDLLSMHEVTGKYAEKRLREDPVLYRGARERHCKFFTGALGEMEKDRWSGGKKALISVVSRDLENIRTAWRWAVSQVDAEAVGLLLGAVYGFYTNRGWFRDGQKLFSEALQALDSSPGVGPEWTVAVGTLRMRLGWLNVNLGNYSEGRSLIARSLDDFRSVGDRSQEASALYYLSAMSLFQGNYDLAENLGSECLESAVASGNDHRLANAWLAKGNIARRMGRFDDAREFYDEGFAMYDRLGDEVGRAVCLGNLGITAYRLGEMEHALELCRSSLTIVEELGDQRLIAECCCDLGNILRDDGRIEEAGQFYARSLMINRELGTKSATAITLVNIGLYERGQGNIRKAISYMTEAFDIAIALGRRPIAMQTLNYRGWMELEQGNDRAAAEYFSTGLGMMPDFRQISMALDVLAGIAAFEGRRGRRERALDILGFILASVTSPEEREEHLERIIPELEPGPTPDELVAATDARSGVSLENMALELLSETALLKN